MSVSDFIRKNQEYLIPFDNTEAYCCKCDKTTHKVLLPLDLIINMDLDDLCLIACYKNIEVYWDDDIKPKYDKYLRNYCILIDNLPEHGKIFIHV